MLSGSTSSNYPLSSINGVGLGLRSQHYQYILNEQPKIPWFEVLIDNYMGEGGQPLDYLSQIRDLYPVTFHGVGLSLGGTDPLNLNYLSKLKDLIDRFEPTLVSDHICWGSVAGVHGNDLFPMPYTSESVNHLVERIDLVQNFLKRRLLIENVSSYLSYQVDIMTEVEFLMEVVKKSDCDILCDVNNIYVSAVNHNFDPIPYIQALPPEKVKEMHLAGYEDQGDYLLDTHGARVHPPVWDLFAVAVERFKNTPTLIEWDTEIPEFSVLVEEQEKAQSYFTQLQNTLTREASLS